MQMTEPDGQDSDEQSSGQRQQEAYEWWWDERLSTFLNTSDAIAETCLEQVFSTSAVHEDVHVDVLADVDDIDTYHESLTPRRFIEDNDGTYDLDWEVETTDGVVDDVFITCHAEYIDETQEVTTEVDVAIVASVNATETKQVTEPHVIHRPISA